MYFKLIKYDILYGIYIEKKNYEIVKSCDRFK
jgi:hypothetical protein